RRSPRSWSAARRSRRPRIRRRWPPMGTSWRQNAPTGWSTPRAAGRPPPGAPPAAASPCLARYCPAGRRPPGARMTRARVAVLRLVGLPGPAHARPGARAFAPVRRQLHHYLVFRHAVPGDDARAFRGLDRLAQLRGLLVEVLIQRMLVLQAAHEPPAGSGDPQRVDGQVLVLGHPDGHRLEVLEEGGAAQVTAARPDPALQPGLVPRADLPQLDPAAEAAGQVADEGAEVDPVRRAEVHGEHRRLVEVVDADHLHRQPVVADQPPGRDPRLGAFRTVVLVPAHVLVGGEASADRQPA